ncbi:hypothetical protein L208DRAFT_1057828, partial [Tricholoma matsutake]
VSELPDALLSSINMWQFLSSYSASGLYALSSGPLQCMLGVLSPSLGFTFTIAARILRGSNLALPFYPFR